MYKVELHKKEQWVCQISTGFSQKEESNIDR